MVLSTRYRTGNASRWSSVTTMHALVSPRKNSMRCRRVLLSPNITSPICGASLSPWRCRSRSGSPRWVSGRQGRRVSPRGRSRSERDAAAWGSRTSRDSKALAGRVVLYSSFITRHGRDLDVKSTDDGREGRRVVAPAVDRVLVLQGVERDADRAVQQIGDLTDGRAVWDVDLDSVDHTLILLKWGTPRFL